MWAYLGDAAHPYNVFDFTLNRRRDGPQQFLAGYQGYLHADAFSGYDCLYLPDPLTTQARIIEVACNAHARRKFYEARTSDALRSHQALAYYRQLYELERQAKDFSASQRAQMRKDLSLPILATFQSWIDKEYPEVLPKSPMAEALGYARNNWMALVRYTEAGFLDIDNNVAEREMKRIAIGRKNWLFIGSPQGGAMAAVMMSFTSTCNRLDVEPWAYLHDVLTRLADDGERRAGRAVAGPLEGGAAGQASRRRRHRLRRATRAKRHLPELAPSIVAPSQPTKELSLVPAVPLVGWWRVRAMTASRPDRHGVRRTDTLLYPAAFVIGATTAGVTGVCIAWLILYPLILACLVALTRRLTGVGLGALVWAQRTVVGAVLFMTVVVLAVRWGMADSERLWLRLVASIAAGMAAYAGVMLALARQTVLADVRALVREMRGG